MQFLVLKCAHCNADNMTATIVSNTAAFCDSERNVFCRCTRCFGPSALILRYVGYGNYVYVSEPGPDGVALQRCALPANGNPLDGGWQIAQRWPAVPAPNIPAGLPPEVERAYLSAEKNFSMDGCEEPATAMYGTALERGTRAVAPEHAALGAKKRIEKLAEEHRITRDLADWAHHVRLLRNETVHGEEQISGDDLKALRAFTEVVLTYLFTFPAMLAERRAANGGTETGPPHRSLGAG